MEEPKDLIAEDLVPAPPSSDETECPPGGQHTLFAPRVQRPQLVTHMPEEGQLKNCVLSQSQGRVPGGVTPSLSW